MRYNTATQKMNVSCSLKKFYIGKTRTGFYHAYHEEQHQQGVADGLERTVDVRYHVPDRATLEVLGGLRNELPYLAQLAVPDLQRVL